MTQEEIIELAKQAGFVDYELDDGTTSAFDKRYERFAALVAAAEREACIKVCMEANVQAMDFTGGTYVGGYFANAIKQRGEKKMNLTNYQDDFIRVRNRPDQAKPEVQHRELERVKVGTWFFGLLPVYKYQYTEWKKQK